MNLPEIDIWEEGIYQLEQTDLVLAGPSPLQGGAGISNLQAEQLARRTLYLLNRLGRFEDIHAVNLNSTTPVVLQAENMLRKHVVVSPVTVLTSYNVSLQGAADMLSGTVLSLSVSALPSTFGRCVKFIAPTGYTFGHRGTSVMEFSTLYLYTGESVQMVKHGSMLIVTSIQAGVFNVGEILHSYKPPIMAVEARGQLVDRAVYPRLWAWLQSSGGAPVVSEATYLANQLNYSGVFTSGNNTTNFRLPDLRSVFIRGLDNGRGLDIGRPYANGGGYEADEFKNHSHGYDPGDNNGVSDDANDRNVMVPGAQNRQTQSVGGAETRPKNVGYTAYIKY